MKKMAHLPRTLWLTGLSGAGKTTLAKMLAHELRQRQQACVVLDGDELRQGLSRDLGYTPADRAENVRRAAEVARLMNDAGLTAIVALISPRHGDRALARGIVGVNFREVHVSTPLAVCEARDVKQLYQAARSGSLRQFTGVSAGYEVPEAPDLAIDTSQVPAPIALARLLALVQA